ncbi:hypothetical protein OKJ48_00510 [Streptomyces kunmingensis]|uniref:Uncharacterized protein n=1 Tax=Streptomyces kunmingensis TaxID=68225 RepID=A0ABU6C3G7_9ACTN|nr:hypothetical protein [Streptomyces kunmingensis]MEB3958746.1 hypothetical protein [Streptomyces kunmingensis]
MSRGDGDGCADKDVLELLRGLRAVDASIAPGATVRAGSVLSGSYVP